MSPRKLTVFVALLLLSGCEDKKNEVPGTPDSKESSKSGEVRRRKNSDRASSTSSANREKARTELDAAKAISSPEEREKAIAKVGWDATEYEPEYVKMAINEMSPGTPERQDLIRAYIAMAIQENYEGVIAWAGALGDSSDSDAAKEEIADAIRGMDPGRALRLLPENGATTDGMSSTAQIILQNWATRNSAEALAWTSNLRPGANRDAAFSTVFDQLVQTEPAAALKWVQSQGNRDVRKKAVEAIAKSMAEQQQETRETILEEADPQVVEEIKGKLAEILPPREQPERDEQPEPEEPVVEPNAE